MKSVTVVVNDGDDCAEELKESVSKSLAEVFG